MTLIDARTGDKIETPLEMAVAGKLHFDRGGRRVLGLFRPANENQRLAWFDLESGELSGVVADGSWPGLPIGTPGIQPPRFALSHRNRWLAVVVTADVPGEQTGNQGPRNEDARRSQIERRQGEDGARDDHVLRKQQAVNEVDEYGGGSATRYSVSINVRLARNRTASP